MQFLAVALTTLALGASSPTDANVAPCEKAIVGHGSAGWRSESIVAGPVGVRQQPLNAMSPTRNGFVTKMPLLVEGRAPETVTVSVPPGLRSRVFLYYGEIVGRDGKPSFSFTEARGYGETVFEPCDDKPRTIWPGGIRIKGAGPVHLLVSAEGRPPLSLPLGRPRAYAPQP
jgi:hypothetical protein